MDTMSDLPGKMKKICQLLVNSDTTTSTGGSVDNYSDAVVTRGYLKRYSGNRDSAFGDIALQNSWTLIVRKEQQITNALRPDIRWRIDGKTFTVQSWEDIDENGFYYKFRLTQETL